MMHSRRKLVAGNWKLNGSVTANRELVSGVLAALPGKSRCDMAICPPSVYLGQVAEQLRGSVVALGAQNLSEFDAGAYTGEVSASMLKEVGCRYVLVGHSERRALFGETNRQVGHKFAAAVKGGLCPVLCVGETLAERESGTTKAVVAAQLLAVMDLVAADVFAQGVIAYEPVWAIGTGKTASPEQAQEVHAFIRSEISKMGGNIAGAVQILYGGSVKASNAAALFACADIDGGLVGGASLQAQEFVAICEAAN